MWVFRSEKGVVLVAEPALVSVGDAAARGGGGVPDAAQVDEQGLVLAEEQCQALGYRLLSDAMLAIDEHQGCRAWLHRPTEYIGGRDGSGDGRTAVAQTSHGDGVGQPRQDIPCS